MSGVKSNCSALHIFYAQVKMHKLLVNKVQKKKTKTISSPRLQTELLLAMLLSSL